MAFSRPVLFRAGRVAAVVVLGVLSVVGGESSAAWWSLAVLCALVAVGLEVSSARWESRSTSPLGAMHEAVHGRALTLIADLAQLAGKEYGLWVVDLYVPQFAFFAWPNSPPKALGLATHLALIDTRAVSSRVKVDGSLVGSVFSECRPSHWWDEELAPSGEENRWSQLDDDSRAQFRDEEYGLISAYPVLSNLGTDCRGVLVVHVRRDAEAATQALSVLRQEEGKRQVAAACRDIFNQLRAG